MNYWLLAILVVVSYFIGNVSFGKILAKRKNVDITKKGSGNPGATNMYRNVGAKLGYLTLLLDLLKGLTSSLMGLLVFRVGGAMEGMIGLYACGLSAIVGHIFPVIYKFKGGKGAATMLGVFAVAQPIPMLIVFIIGFIFVWFCQYVSLASLLFVTIMVIYQNLTLTPPNLAVSLMTFAIFLLIWFVHRANIERLLKGKETATNIKQKIFKDKKYKQKLEEKAEEKAEKIEIKYEKSEEKAELKQEKAEIKSEIKEAIAEIKVAKKQIKQVRKTVVTAGTKKKKSLKDKKSTLKKKPTTKKKSTTALKRKIATKKKSATAVKGENTSKNKNITSLIKKIKKPKKATEITNEETKTDS